MGNSQKDINERIRNDMIYVVLDNLIIMVLTVIGLFTSKAPSVFVIVASLIMVLITYESFNEDKSRGIVVFELILMTFFSVLSGGFTGFIVFFLLKAFREYVRIIIEVCLFIAAKLVIYKNMSLAMCIVEILILAAVFSILVLLYYTIDSVKKRKIKETEKIVVSNISEMHEKRLNEQLVMQHYLAEKNARLVERENISRNIHNSVGHSITAAIMTLDAADMLYDVKPDEARKKMNDANERIRGSLESIRRAVRVLDEECPVISAGDLKYEMENIINEFVMDTDIQVNRDFDWLMEDIKISNDHAVFLTGVLQEMLTNGVKHGNASEFMVILFGDTAHIRLEVSDNGQSDFCLLNSKNRIENGFGIKKIISYAEKCGGKTLFENNNGFKGIVELPIMIAD
ncbi:MAG: sensor histidine kinase [Coprococcus sp.]